MAKQQKHSPVDAAVGRRRTRRGTAVVGVLPALPFAALAVVAATGTGPVVPLVVTGVAAVAGVLMISEVHTGRELGQVTGNRLTARTPTGVRTVDLGDVRSVRLLTSFSYGGVSDRVVLVRDGSGVCLGLREPTDLRRVRRALERVPPHDVQPRVSRAARAHLHMTAGGTGPHTVLVWPATVLGATGCLFAVLRLAGLVRA
ncbi:hypothetical protein ACGFYA_34530 [Streptomyces sp. NPDC048305]|uniref:hypothetical protein n=1 Tax=Streptomyces sp. NPDC048305 TaxID=3365532 RepID=UPI0037140A72